MKVEFKRAHQGDIWVSASDIPPNCTLFRYLTVGHASLILYQVQVAVRVLKKGNP